MPGVQARKAWRLPCVSSGGTLGPGVQPLACVPTRGTAPEQEGGLCSSAGAGGPARSPLSSPAAPSVRIPSFSCPPPRLTAHLPPQRCARSPVSPRGWAWTSRAQGAGAGWPQAGCADPALVGCSAPGGRDLPMVET